ncbi:peptidoglycan DD-metalloendopeptidase family protein [Brevundimonas sp.]|uniref:peptidoglycan DD-metalloendopeptidase family protein n=1 Tax=Brevundimonas sp. TaxID=1871086 RepID=UPI003BAD2EEF
MSINRWIKGVVIAGAALTAAACSTYPDAPRYSTRPTTPGVPQIQGQGTNVPAYPTNPMPAPRPYEAPPPIAAPYEPIQGGALPPPSSGSVGPTYLPERPVAPPVSSGASLGASGTVAYTIQPGDTISGVGRRFQAPVQSLIDLNSLGPRGAITPGQRVILPDNAVDLGPDPYATGPAPIGVAVTNAGTAPPPPPPPPAMASVAPRPANVVPTTPAAPVASAPSTPTSVALQWPLRGEVVRRFGPVGMGERNNGINIAASAGAEVVASAAGRVAYVGDDLVGQGLTVLIVHRDGWRTVYGHLGSATVDDGDDVRAGQQIGTVGLTAGDGRPSIHYETRRMSGDEPVAVDPLTVLPR